MDFDFDPTQTSDGRIQNFVNELNGISHSYKSINKYELWTFVGLAANLLGLPCILTLLEFIDVLTKFT